MEQLLLSNFSFFSFKINERKIEMEIDSFFEKVSMFEDIGEKCFSTENCFISSDYVRDSGFSITEWEWDNNEIYLNKKLIKKRFREAIYIAISRIETLLTNKFPDNSFHIIVSAQCGSLRNVVIRLYLDRGDAYLDENLEKYNQPVLSEILRT